MISRLLQASIMAVWAVFFLWLFAVDQPALARLLHPRLWWLVLGGAVVLLLFCGVAFSRLTAPDPSTGLRWTWPSYLVLIVPLVYFWPMQSARFDSRTFLDRSTSITALAPVQGVATAQDPLVPPKVRASGSDVVLDSQIQGDMATPTPLRPTGETALLETLSSQIPLAPPLQNETATQDPVEPTDESVSFSQIIIDPKQYTGRKVEVVCQVLSDQRLPSSQFICYRFRISCCAADALPVYLFVEKQGHQVPVNDSWVRVQGMLSTHKVNGAPFPLIHADGIHADKEPSFPFVF